MKKIFYVVIGAVITISPIFAEAQLWQSSGTNIYTTNTGKVGINNVSPSAKLDISLNGTPAITTFPTQTALHVTGGNSDNVVFQMDVFGGHGIFDIRRANGTSASPTALLKDDEIGALAFRGYGDSSGYATGSSGKAALTTYASENWNATNQGTYMLLSVTPNGTKNLTTALKLGGDLSGGVTKNFGIGTFLPNVFGYNADIQRVLTIYGGPNVGSRAVLELVSDPLNNVSGNTVGQIDFNAQSQTSTKRIAVIQGLLTGTTTGDYGSDLVFLTKANGGTVTEKLRISNTGNVGIGTTNPLGLLHINAQDSVGSLIIGGGKTTVTTVGETNSQLDFRSNDVSVNNANQIGGRISSITEFNNGARTGLGFFTFNQTVSPGLSEKVRIDYQGNVGIGTTSPKAKLDVSGDIKLSGSLISDGDICIGKCQ
jgi:hypothetical protein